MPSPDATKEHNWRRINNDYKIPYVTQVSLWEAGNGNLAKPTIANVAWRPARGAWARQRYYFFAAEHMEAQPTTFKLQ